MQPAALPDTNVLARADGTDWAALFDRMPQLPSFRQRWTVRRKSAVIEAVRGGWVPIDEICQLYSLSIDEFLAWERDIDRHGVHGLRTTRYQVYRDTEAQKSVGTEPRPEHRKRMLIDPIVGAGKAGLVNSG
jgi:hypothetical protein